jgi:hypothetical protein
MNILTGIEASDIEYLNVKYLSVDPLTRRDTYDPKTMKMIEEDIAEHGFRKEHPLVVRPDKTKRGHYKITCGQHRFEAGVNRGICTFPCIIKEFQDDIHAISEAYKDNVLACQVDAITEAEYFKKFGLLLLKERGHSENSVKRLKRKYPEELIALQMGVGKDYVKHRLALLRLPKIVKWMIKRYYQRSERGLKLSPTIGSELSRIYKNIWQQKKAGTTKVKAKSAITKLALKLSREKATLHETRKIGAEIAYKGYDEWLNSKPVEEKIRCAKCGEVVVPEDNPWLALCPAHKEKYLNRRLKPNPHLKPLHECNPEQHTVKGVTIYSKESEGKEGAKGVTAINKSGFSGTKKGSVGYEPNKTD